MAVTLFHMWGIFRQSLIDSHNFYVEQAQKRLLSQFDDIEIESDQYGKDKLEEYAAYYNPDADNGDELQEAAYEKMCNHYQMLEDMRNRTRLSIVAGLFHEWDKQVRDWMIREMNHWHCGDEAKRELWKADFNKIANLLESLGWKIKSQSYYTSLDRCRLVVNAYKHGDGPAFQTIKSQYPEFINRPTDDATYINYADHSDLLIEDNHIAEFSNAIIKFWQGVPEYILNDATLSFPEWFEKALQKDIDQTQKTKVAKT